LGEVAEVPDGGTPSLVVVGSTEGEAAGGAVLLVTSAVGVSASGAVGLAAEALIITVITLPSLMS